jgi:hypothetical protein
MTDDEKLNFLLFNLKRKLDSMSKEFDKVTVEDLRWLLSTVNQIIDIRGDNAR